jgi:hypothetical protein
VVEGQEYDFAEIMRPPLSQKLSQGASEYLLDVERGLHISRGMKEADCP